MIGHGVSSGPLPYSNLLPGDVIPAVPASAANNFTPVPSETNLHDFGSAEDNSHEGFYIDDIIIGFTGRGEMITSAPANTTTFSKNTAIDPKT